MEKHLRYVLIRGQWHKEVGGSLDRDGEFFDWLGNIFAFLWLVLEAETNIREAGSYPPSPGPSWLIAAEVLG